MNTHHARNRLPEVEDIAHTDRTLGHDGRLLLRVVVCCRRYLDSSKSGSEPVEKSEDWQDAVREIDAEANPRGSAEIVT